MTPDPQRIALIVPTASGGTAAHVAELAAGCRDAGLAVRAFGPPATASLLGPDIGFEPVWIGGRPRPVSDARAVLRLRAGLRGWRPHVVHAHGVRAGAFAALALRGLRPSGSEVPRADTVSPGSALLTPAAEPARLVVTVHNAAPSSGSLARLAYRLLGRVCARRADDVLCASEDLADGMRALGAARVSVYAVPAPLASPPSGEAIAKAAADIGAGTRPVVLAVGRLAAQKGFDVLVAAAGRWRDRVPAPRTVIAGNGPLAGDLRRQAERAGADVLLLGHRDDVPALLAVADVVAVPSRWEARSLVLQQAMRAGKPVVATRVGGTPGLTGEDAAALIPPDDPAALAAAVTKLIDDPRLAAGLGRAAAARSGSFPTQEDALSAALTLYARLRAS